MARILSVNTGKSRSITVNGHSVRTGIFKSPVEGAVAVERCNLEGDQIADLRVHGGPYKAVYLYPSEHYDYWKSELSLTYLPFGAFGENLTTEGLTERTAHIGDQFRVGSSILQVTQPRMPCFKLALRFQLPEMVKKFWHSERSGIYFSVVQEGQLAAGNAIEQIASDPEKVSVADVVRLYKGTEWSSGLLERALRSPLFSSWKWDIQTRLTEAD